LFVSEQLSPTARERLLPIEGPNTNIYAKKFDSNGIQIGDRIAIASSDLFPQVDPDVAMDPSGNFIVTYGLTVSPPNRASGPRVSTQRP
jgi:hypothetical protein